MRCVCVRAWGVEHTCTFYTANAILSAPGDLSMMCNLCSASPKMRDEKSDVKYKQNQYTISVYKSDLFSCIWYLWVISLAHSPFIVHCEVGEWTHWGPCVQIRSIRPHRRGEESRTRQVLRSPSLRWPLSTCATDQEVCHQEETKESKKFVLTW